MTQKLLIFKGFTGPITHFFGKATLKTNPTHFLNFLFGPVKNFFMAKLGRIVAKSDPNLANLDLADLMCAKKACLSLPYFSQPNLKNQPAPKRIYGAYRASWVIFVNHGGRK